MKDGSIIYVFNTCSFNAMFYAFFNQWDRSQKIKEFMKNAKKNIFAEVFAKTIECSTDLTPIYNFRTSFFMDWIKVKENQMNCLSSLEYVLKKNLKESNILVQGCPKCSIKNDLINFISIEMKQTETISDLNFGTFFTCHCSKLLNNQIKIISLHTIINRMETSIQCSLREIPQEFSIGKMIFKLSSVIVFKNNHFSTLNNENGNWIKYCDFENEPTPFELNLIINVNSLIYIRT